MVDVLIAEGHSIKHFAPTFIKHLPFCRPKWDPVQHLLCPCVGQNGNLLSSNSCALVPLHLHLRPFKSIFQNHLHGDLARLNYQKKSCLISFHETLEVADDLFHIRKCQFNLKYLIREQKSLLFYTQFCTNPSKCPILYSTTYQLSGREACRTEVILLM